MSTYRISFTVELDHENDEEIDTVQETMNDVGADAIADGLRRLVYGTSLRSVRNINVTQGED